MRAASRPPRRRAPDWAPVRAAPARPRCPARRQPRSRLPKATSARCCWWHLDRSLLPQRGQSLEKSVETGPDPQQRPRHQKPGNGPELLVQPPPEQGPQPDRADELPARVDVGLRLPVRAGGIVDTAARSLAGLAAGHPPPFVKAAP